MVKRENILQELEAISASVAAISNRNVYCVPRDYFDALAEEVLARVQTSSFVPSTPFTVPEDYFNNFTFAVLQKIKGGENNKTNSPVFEELEVIAPILNRIGKTELYTLPVGYFENLPESVLQKIKLLETQQLPNPVFKELQQIAPLLNTISKQAPYKVAQGYFEKLQDSIAVQLQQEEGNNLEIGVFEELEQLAPFLNTISKQTPYNTPNNYFESFVANVSSSEVFDELNEVAPLLNIIGKQNVFSIPQGYFENFSIDTTEQIAVENTVGESGVFLELQEIAPLLNTISKTVPYAVPENYFGQLSVNVAVEKPKAKVIGLSRSTKRVITWLAAASFTGIIAMSGYMFWQGYTKPIAPGPVTASLSDVSDEEISNYLNSTPLPGVETIPSSVLDEQIPEPEPVIQNLSTDEIKDYLEKNSDPDEKSLSDI